MGHELRKIGVIGTGKTGSRVLQLLGEDSSIEVVAFNSSNPVDLDGLDGLDLAIVFLDGATFENVYPLLLEARTPLICGTTGFDFNHEIQELVQERGTHWVIASNFSPLMCAIEGALRSLGSSPVLEGMQVRIDETHHVHKKDAPSGTALRWGEWYGREVEYGSHREGDVIGEHRLEIITPYETLSIQHSALSRDLFASGAILAARHLAQLRKCRALVHGLYTFHQLEEEIKCMN